MSIRIQRRRATVKDLSNRLPHAYRHDAVRLVRRSTVVLDLLVHHVPVEVLHTRWGLSIACLSHGRRAFLRRGLDRLLSHQSAGRRATVTPRQKQRLGELLEAGPQVVGGAPACGPSGRIRVLLWRECGVLSHGPSVGTLRPKGGGAFPQARVVAAHLAAAKRLAWLAEHGPALVRAATRRGALILCENAARWAQGGSLRSTWARRGRPPEVPTSGKRQGSTGCGASASGSGRRCSQGREGRLPSESSHGVLPRLMEQTTQPRWRIPAGARYPPSAAPHAFVAAHRDRITVEPLPSDAPDDHPMAYLGQKTKQRAPHHPSCKAWALLTVSGDKALAYWATPPATV